MPIESFNEIPEYMSNNQDNEEVKNYISGLVTTDRVENFLETEDGKKILQPKLDRNFNKGLDSWKTNNLQKLIDDAVSKANPEESKEQKMIRELTERINKAEKDKTHESLRNNALKLANEKKLPTSIIDYFIGEDEESTKSNLEALENVFSEYVNNIAEERLKGGYKPPVGGQTTTFTMEQIKKMSPEEINKNWDAIQTTLKNNK
jgi:hypothetical protein